MARLLPQLKVLHLRLGLLGVVLLFSLETAAVRPPDRSSAVLQGSTQDASQIQPAWRMHTLFSVECNDYFDWQTVGLIHSYKTSAQPGPITRLLSCTDRQLEEYRGMDLAPTHVVPSMSRHPRTGDWYPAINKPAGVVHWLENSADAKDVDWVVILDADMVIRHPIVPWELNAEKGKPVAAAYGYLIGCDNILAKLHTKNPEYCDKVGGMIIMHIDDLRAMAPLWLSKTEEVRADKEHWATDITGDIYGLGWISEMYGYSFGAAEVGLRHKITYDLMIYPGYIPMKGIEPILLHYGLKFSVGNWSFSKADHNGDDIVYECNRLFPAPPYLKEVLVIEGDFDKRRSLFLSIECINTINEGLVIHHASHGCSKPPKSKYLSFLKVWRMNMQNYMSSTVVKIEETNKEIGESSRKEIVGNPVLDSENPSGHEKARELQPEQGENITVSYPKIHTLFSAECSTYFDWQTVGLIHSFLSSGQPGYITRLLSCTDEQMKAYKGMNLGPTHLVPSYSLHPLTGDWYPAINKPAAVLHWINHVQTDAEFVVILDADMILRAPITPWKYGAEKGYPVSVPYNYLIGCDNILAQLHTRYPEACDKVGGVIIMHIDDLRTFAPLWLHKTEEVRADRAHFATNITGDVYEQGWISEMYGYSFGAAEIKLRHRIRDNIMMYPGYIPPEGIEPCVLHYGLEFHVGNWSFDKARWRDEDMTNVCWKAFPEPPDPSSLISSDLGELRRDKISIECIRTINDALYLHHKAMGCSESELKKDMDINAEATNHPGFSNEKERQIEEQAEEKENKMEIEVNNSDGGVQDDEIIELSNVNTRNEIEVDGVNNTHFNRVTLEETSLKEQRRLFGSMYSFPVLSDSPKYWMVALWTLLVFGFLLVMSYTYSRSHSNGHKHKPLKNKFRRQYPNEKDTDGGSLLLHGIDD